LFKIDIIWPQFFGEWSANAREVAKIYETIEKGIRKWFILFILVEIRIVELLGLPNPCYKMGVLKAAKASKATTYFTYIVGQ
jgi:hypothetical protein